MVNPTPLKPVYSLSWSILYKKVRRVRGGVVGGCGLGGIFDYESKITTVRVCEAIFVT